MPLTIWKEKLDIFKQLDADGVLYIDLPAGAKVLRVSRQFDHDETVFMWYACNPEAPRLTRAIFVVGTGHPFPDSILEHYIGTEIFHRGGLVLHFFLYP